MGYKDTDKLQKPSRENTASFIFLLVKFVTVPQAPSKKLFSL